MYLPLELDSENVGGPVHGEPLLGRHLRLAARTVIGILVVEGFWLDESFKRALQRVDILKLAGKLLQRQINKQT